MKTQVIDIFTLIKEINIQLPNAKQPDWLTHITCANSAGLHVKVSLSSVDRYANIWTLCNNFEEMELIDLYDGRTKYEFGRFKLRIKYEGHYYEQWFKHAHIQEV